jgi:type IV pilus assembly protein PilC
MVTKVPRAVAYERVNQEQPSVSSRVRAEDVLRFVRALSVKLKAGLSIEKCLAALANETKNGQLRVVCTELHKEVTGGCPLSLTMREYSGVFDDATVRMVENGEQTGNLRGALANVADYLEHNSGMYRAVRVAVLRPLEVLSLILLVIFIATVALSFLVKEFLPAASEGHHATVSATDQIALLVSENVRNFWPLVGAFGAIIFLILNLLPRFRMTRVALDALAMKVPLVKNAIHTTELACYVRTVGILMRAGAMLSDAMQIAARSIRNQSMRAAVGRTLEKIEKGKPYIEALVDDGLMRRRDVIAVQTAERRGELPAFVMTQAEEREREAIDRVMRLKTLTHTLVMMVLGLCIVAVVVTLYVPVFVLR